MQYNKKTIRLSKHAQEQCVERGATEDEVKKAIMEASWEAAKNGKYECKYTFQFSANWIGRHYAVKEVRPIFADEPDEIVVITVYTYYN